MVIFPNAKINLGLSIISKRTDGFHSLESVFYPVPWRDILEVLPAEKFEFTSSGIVVSGAAEDNLCMKVYSFLKDAFCLPPVHIHLHKNIPVGAGLGGGSSDAAHTLKALNEIFEMKLIEARQEELIRPFGSDCAFFIRNRPMLALEKGDVLEPVMVTLKDKYLVLVYPDIFISTKEAYSRIQPSVPPYSIRDLVKADLKEWKENLKNDFEAALFPLYPALSAVKEKLYSLGAIYASMSGSGSALYGIFEEEPPLKNVFPENYRLMKARLEI
jgi:4-diphosphocytidyl-2-C-methyl-D-erythritol kinase